jgi:hypothetical protein
MKSKVIHCFGKLQVAALWDPARAQKRDKARNFGPSRISPCDLGLRRVFKSPWSRGPLPGTLGLRKAVRAPSVRSCARAADAPAIAVVPLDAAPHPQSLPSTVQRTDPLAFAVVPPVGAPRSGPCGSRRVELAAWPAPSSQLVRQRP